MCFYIDENAKRPADKVVFKAVKRKQWGRGFTWAGPYYDVQPYVVGKVITARSLAKGERLRFKNHNASNHGIYVFETRDQAEKYAREKGCQAIATLHVRPSDWVCTASDINNRPKEGARTYRRVKVLSIESLK